MTIYVDDFHLSPASLDKHPVDDRRRVRMAHMLGTDRDELHKFARTIGLNLAWYRGPLYFLMAEEQAKAVQLGAILVSAQQLAAMNSLYLAGYDPEPPETAVARRCLLAVPPGTPQPGLLQRL